MTEPKAETTFEERLDNLKNNWMAVGHVDVTAPGCKSPEQSPKTIPEVPSGAPLTLANWSSWPSRANQQLLQYLRKMGKIGNNAVTVPLMMSATQQGEHLVFKWDQFQVHGIVVDEGALNDTSFVRFIAQRYGALTGLWRIIIGTARRGKGGKEIGIKVCPEVQRWYFSGIVDIDASIYDLQYSVCYNIVVNDAGAIKYPMGMMIYLTIIADSWSLLLSTGFAPAQENVFKHITRQLSCHELPAAAQSQSVQFGEQSQVNRYIVKSDSNRLYRMRVTAFGMSSLNQIAEGNSAFPDGWYTDKPVHHMVSRIMVATGAEVLIDTEPSEMRVSPDGRHSHLHSDSSPSIMTTTEFGARIIITILLLPVVVLKRAVCWLANILMRTARGVLMLIKEEILNQNVT